MTDLLLTDAVTHRNPTVTFDATLARIHRRVRVWRRWLRHRSNSRDFVLQRHLALCDHRQLVDLGGNPRRSNYDWLSALMQR